MPCMSFTRAHTHCVHTHWAAKGDICVRSALLKSPVSVKLDLGIIITSKTTEAYLSRLAPTSTQPPRYTVRVWSHWYRGPVHDGLIQGIVSLQVQREGARDERRQRRWKSKRLMRKKERKKPAKRGTRGARGSDKTLVVQILAVTVWESNSADALFAAASYYPAVPRGSQPMLTQTESLCSYRYIFFIFGATFLLLFMEPCWNKHISAWKKGVNERFEVKEAAHASTLLSSSCRRTDDYNINCFSI